jgi:hypothetical protein
MQADALADRIINYCDAVAAFSLVNALAFVVTLAEPDIRCSMAAIAGPVIAGHFLISACLTGLLVWLRGFERSLRPDAGNDERVQTFWRYAQRVRIGLVWFVAVFVSFGILGATLDPRCAAVAGG